MNRNFLTLAVALGAAGTLAAQDLPFRQPHRSADGAAVISNTQTAASASGKEPGPPLTTADKLLSFDAQATEIRWVDNRWQLLAGGVWLKDFGPNEAAAREAVRIIRELGINQHGTIGTPRPVMEYWLRDGQAPNGFVPSPRRLPLDLNTLRVEQMQGQWCLRDSYRIFFAFGGHREEANEALQTIRRYGFTTIGQVGQGALAMTYFLANQGFGSGRMAMQPPIVSRRVTHDAPAADARAPGNETPAANNPGIPGTLPNGLKLAALNPLAASQAIRGDRVCIDPYHLEIKQDKQGWKLCSSDYTIARFGSSQAAARQAASALQFYRCNEHCLVGESRPIFSFFLANGQPPRGLMFGLSGVFFRPEALMLRQLDGEWALCDREQPLVRLGSRLEDAQALLRIVQQQHFDHLCHIGPAQPDGINLLIRAR